MTFPGVASVLYGDSWRGSCEVDDAVTDAESRL